MRGYLGKLRLIGIVAANETLRADRAALAARAEALVEAGNELERGTLGQAPDERAAWHAAVAAARAK